MSTNRRRTCTVIPFECSQQFATSCSLGHQHHRQGIYPEAAITAFISDQRINYAYESPQKFTNSINAFRLPMPGPVCRLSAEILYTIAKTLSASVGIRPMTMSKYWGRHSPPLHHSDAPVRLQ